MITVAVTMRVTSPQEYDEPRDSISHDWLRLLQSWQMTPLPVPNIGAAVFDYFKVQQPDLFIFTGGEDIGVSPERDQTEILLLEYALKSNMPVFGVCRGLQFLNTYFGGILRPVDGHVATPHNVTIMNEWQSFYGPEVMVNSYHNVCLPRDGLADALEAMAYDKSGHVEGLRHRNEPIAAVMWHPERGQAPRHDFALVQSLIAHKGWT